MGREKGGRERGRDKEREEGKGKKRKSFLNPIQLGGKCRQYYTYRIKIRIFSVLYLLKINFNF